MKTLRIGIVSLMLILPLAMGCGKSGSGIPGMGDLTSMLGASPDLSTLTSLINSAGLGDLLGGDSPVTLLAPTNQAFQALGEDTLNMLTDPANKDQLANVLKNHVVPGNLSADQLGDLTTAPQTELGNPLEVMTGDDGGLTINGAHVLDSMEGENGYIHKIDKVIVPE